MSIIIPVAIVAVIGLIAGVGLSLASKFMSVPTDETVEKITEVLPGANCGACGFSGCSGYAAAIASGEAEPDRCAPGGAAAASAISEILGVEIATVKRVAHIACNGDCDTSKIKYNYDGIHSCSAAVLLHSGPKECAYGCIGYGDCVAACSFGAIEVRNGKPYICRDLCVGCGMCARVCPKGLISLVPENVSTTVGCNNKAKGAAVAKSCTVSCLACGMCVKACEAGAVRLVDNLPVIDYELCNSCGKCKAACKRGVLN